MKLTTTGSCSSDQIVQPDTIGVRNIFNDLIVVGSTLTMTLTVSCLETLVASLTFTLQLLLWYCRSIRKLVKRLIIGGTSGLFFSTIVTMSGTQVTMVQVLDLMLILDGVQGSSFLRSDVNTTKTAGQLFYSMTVFPFVLVLVLMLNFSTMGRICISTLKLQVIVGISETLVILRSLHSQSLLVTSVFIKVVYL